MIIISKHIIPDKFVGLTIFPFIFLKNKDLKGNRTLVNHEKIHLKQQLELLWVPFFLWYSVEFLIKLIIYKNWHEAYRNISFEKEAYQNESNFNYLNQRKLFAFLKLL
ncbi:hypothetical protein [Urechidicola croceus]|uniref:DUF4157 domain-containing protein n=1 Tax=Urechidicola croceus TaxID=1850246 RepID=A0A1D8P758_9FLAO|nr:hypothetical protein [Urechidicola croceus]AOW20393.1 hypothetical protein LPB138_06775 [Urechidicola croceus]